MTHRIKVITTVLVIMAGSGCAYFNTFFNAKQSYKSGMKKLERVKSGQVSSDIKNDFEKAIDKSWKLINAYSDSNKYADDALLLIGKSHYHIQEYEKTERYLTQFVGRYADSELLPEAKLWLARSLVYLKKEDEALRRFNEILASESDRDIAAYALYGLGELYLKQEDYSNAITNLKRCVEVSKDDKISAEAQFFIGNIYFEQEEYIYAIENYSMVLKYDTPLNIDFESQYNKATAQIYIGKFDEASASLLKMLRAERYKEKYGLIQAKVGECYELQGDKNAAARQYLYVIEEYSRTEGASLASYYLAQLMEIYFADIDSARKLYLRATKEFNQFEFKKEANDRSEILNQYLDLKDDIAYDILDLEKVGELDSMQINELIAMDSLRGDEDSTQIENLFANQTDDLAFTSVFDDSSMIPDQPGIDEQQTERNTMLTDADKQESANGDMDNQFDMTLNPEDTLGQGMDSLNRPLDLNFERTKKNTQRKTRHKADIELSLKKNRFKLAEFFLLTMQNYDSAEAAYQKFITLYEDSSLTPKAYHALNYIYTFILIDSVKQDSIEQIVLYKYPGSEYADYIINKNNPQMYEDDKEDVQVDLYKDQYLNAEKELFDDNYTAALDLFNMIASEDSGGVWGQKARYAVAWIYEKKLNDVPKAIEVYTLLSREYPNSEIGAVAQNKIKEPPPEVAPDDSTAMLEQAEGVPSDSLIEDSSMEEMISDDPLTSPAEGREEE